MRLNLINLQKVKELCMCNPNVVITIDDIDYCWVVNSDSIEFKDGAFRVDFANGWETLYI